MYSIHIYMNYIYISNILRLYVYIWRALFRTAISVDSKIGFAMLMLKSQLVFWNGKELLIYIWKCSSSALRSKPWSINLALALQTYLWDLRLSHLGKYIYVCKYMKSSSDICVYPGIYISTHWEKNIYAINLTLYI